MKISPLTKHRLLFDSWFSWSAAMPVSSFSHHVMSPKPGESAFWKFEFHLTAVSPTLVIILMSLCNIPPALNWSHLPPLCDQMFVSLYNAPAASSQGYCGAGVSPSLTSPPPSDSRQAPAKAVFHCKITISQKQKACDGNIQVSLKNIVEVIALIWGVPVLLLKIKLVFVT